MKLKKKKLYFTYFLLHRCFCQVPGDQENSNLVSLLDSFDSLQDLQGQSRFFLKGRLSLSAVLPEKCLINYRVFHMNINIRN